LNNIAYTLLFSAQLSLTPLELPYIHSLSVIMSSGVNFLPDHDIPDLAGKVIFVTGGSFRPFQPSVH
jgi:hypothetical protein